MKVVAKALVALLLLLLVALPVLACVQPGVAMTAAERACCKQMAQRCGDAGMAKSHGCCHPQVSRADWHALQSSPPLDHILGASQARPAADGAVVNLQIVPIVPAFSSTDSPPGLLYPDTTILRI